MVQMKSQKKEYNISHLSKNKKGRIADVIPTLLVGFLAVIFLTALLPGIVQSLGVSKASNSLNCPGYVDPNSVSLSYNSSLSTNTIGCTAVDFTPGLIVLGVVFGIVLKLLYGSPSGPQDLGYQ